MHVKAFMCIQKPALLTFTLRIWIFAVIGRILMGASLTLTPLTLPASRGTSRR